MSISIKIRWKERTGHVKGYDTKKNLVFSESFSAPTRKAFSTKVQKKLEEYAGVDATTVETA